MKLLQRTLLLLEVIAFAGGLLALLFKYLTWPQADQLAALFWSVLALVYLLGGWLLFSRLSVWQQAGRNSPERQYSLVTGILGGFAMAMIALGLLFRLMLWPAGTSVMVMGLFGTGMILAVEVLWMRLGPTGKLRPFAWRAFPLMAVAVLLLLLPKGFFFRKKYGDCCPEVIQAWEKRQQRPTKRHTRQFLNAKARADSILQNQR